MSEIRIRRALISVSDKAGLETLARALHRHGVEILASGGTGRALKDIQIPYTEVEKFTGNPEAFDGRMKTISFKLESAILFDRHSPKHIEQAESLGIPPIDAVICNFYPFEKAAARGANWDELVAEVDVGGPTMVRAAAKNHGSVAVLVDPNDYTTFIQELDGRKGSVSAAFRKDMMLKAFAHVLDYDRAIYETFSRLSRTDDTATSQALALDTVVSSKILRYGENPHQKAVFYKKSKAGAVDWELIDGAGLELSYNNILDAEAAFGALRDVWRVAPGRAAVTIVKHQNPCGMATADKVVTAFERAWAGDPVSSFGGVIAMSAPLSRDVAELLETRFVEVILAPSVDPAALQLLRSKKKNLRILKINSLEMPRPAVIQHVEGGYLVQDADDELDTEFQSVTKAKLPSELFGLARFGSVAAKWVKSNAIALVRNVGTADYQLVGIGSGQPNRVDAVRRLSIPRAEDAFKAMGEDAKSGLTRCLLASDAFFPFPDSVEYAAQAGVKYIIQPGGSRRDDEVIATCDRYGVAMALTGRRHFRH